ncbi:cytolytic toxin-alpha-like [Tachysurus fulvidraco]|uniref:cytolytic toxin-alpha-like n=1 Tax=Tachysurus fulvidraco TaxID=1234273 RepID=UPI001FEEABA2|nr:cytolytic toxin-alpha-like [Tachysurus fulvidraco]
MEPKIIQMAALGRALYPGMLYDCRSDSFIPGVTLWDKKALRNDIDVHDQTRTFVKLAASDSLSSKANLLDVSASLKASFFCGLVEVGGSAKYLQDSKSSTRQSRVTMQYSQTTKFEQLTMKELGNITYPQVFDQKSATHVVTAVLYGATAFMVFDYTSSESENKQEIEGNLHAVVKKIPTISIEGQASLTMNQQEKKLSENLNVTFYGDYELDENPTTYAEALKACNTLPSLLRKKSSKGVPLTVWLYPLTLLDARAAKLVREISLSFVAKTEKLLEELDEVQRRCNDMIKMPVTNDFPEIKEKLKSFQELIGYYKVAFQKALVSVLPNIRSGAVDDSALGLILENHYKSPFTAVNMNKWLDDNLGELNILTSYTSGLKDMPVVTSSGSFNSILFDADVDVLVSFTFTSLQNEDSFITAIEDFVNSEGFSNLDQNSANAFTFQAIKPWFMSSDISAKMRQNLSLFTSFYKANKNVKKVKFIVASISDPSNPGSSIQLYQNGTLTNANFQPVSKPAAPVVDTSDGKVTLNLSKSTTGDTLQFKIEYRNTQPTDSASDATAWKVITTPDAKTTFNLTGIKQDEQQWVRYSAIGKVGVSEASDYVPFIIAGKIIYAISQWGTSVPVLIDKIRNKIMTNTGMSRWSNSIIKSEIQNAVNSPTIAFTGPITGGLKTGMAMYFQGSALATGKSFEIDFIAGAKETGDVTLYMGFNIDDSLSFNTRRGPNWETQECITSYTVAKGSAFDVFFVVKQEGWEVYLNGQKVYLFKHRMPVETVTTLHIHGDTVINIMGTIPNWSNSTFGKELASGTSRTKTSNIQTDVPNPVSNPKKNYAGNIPAEMRPGVALFFKGVVPSDFDCFAVNLLSSQTNDIGLHFKLMPNLVVFNTCRSGLWEEQIEIKASPFVKGGAFDFFLLASTIGFEVIVNGMPCCTFTYRMPVEKINSIQVNGDVFMNTFATLEVGSVNMKALVPANI